MQAISIAGATDIGRSSTETGLPSIQQQYERIRQGIGIATGFNPGKFHVTGPGALDAVNRAVLGDVSRLPIKKMMQTFMLREDGSLLADVYVVNQGNGFLIITEGAEPVRIHDVLKDAAGRDASVEDVTRSRSIISVDGPYSWELLKDLVGMGILGTRYMEVMTDQEIAGVPLSLYRAGKTGEFGYWLDVGAEHEAAVRAALMETGEGYDLTPYGSEVLTLCKLENRFINVEREGAVARDVLELNCRIMVSRDKGDYIGREAVERAIESGPRRRLVGLTLGEEKSSFPVIGAEVRIDGTQIGTLANVGCSYALGKHIAVALVDVDYGYVGLDYEVGSGGDRYQARTVSAPFILNRSLGIRVQEHSYFDQEQ